MGVDAAAVELSGKPYLQDWLERRARDHGRYESIQHIV
jgi:hypothetical protein